MHTSTDPSNTPNASAPRFSIDENVAHVSHTTSFHQSAAMYAAQMVRFQYTKTAKNQFRRECLDHLKASLAPGASKNKASPA
ncbi:hypothetical protein [Pseudomonas sp. MWU12-2345]|uniref:hypothetical protein n=1 Tax=Pseudomonas sp. MWU12-2345 TaxID=2928689 RepID=UPI00200CBC23|nr:hypothetical protein [Pseudomonas sp. MWU12-2345]